MTSYSVGYYAAWIVAIAGVIAGVLAGIGYSGLRPSWETQDISATAGIISAICVGLAAILPQVTRSPAARESRYIAALAGMLPDDIAKKHNLTVTPEPGGLKVETPEEPPPH
jgi:hypothetical protein